MIYRAWLGQYCLLWDSTASCEAWFIGHDWGSSASCEIVLPPFVATGAIDLNSTNVNLIYFRFFHLLTFYQFHTVVRNINTLPFGAEGWCAHSVCDAYFFLLASSYITNRPILSKELIMTMLIHSFCFDIFLKVNIDTGFCMGKHQWASIIDIPVCAVD
jgi:hypothetical protein